MNSNAVMIQSYPSFMAVYLFCCIWSAALNLFIAVWKSCQHQSRDSGMNGWRLHTPTVVGWVMNGEGVFMVAPGSGAAKPRQRGSIALPRQSGTLLLGGGSDLRRMKHKVSMELHVDPPQFHLGQIGLKSNNTWTEQELQSWIFLFLQSTLGCEINLTHSPLDTNGKSTN